MTGNSLFIEVNMVNLTCCSRCIAATCIDMTHSTKISTSSILLMKTRLYSQKGRLQVQIKQESYTLVLRIHQMRIKDCPVSIEDAEVATKIWGPNIAALKGKTTWSTPKHVITDIVKIPVEIRDLHKFISISIDIFFVNKIIFFITLSQKSSSLQWRIYQIVKWTRFYKRSKVYLNTIINAAFNWWSLRQTVNSSH